MKRDVRDYPPAVQKQIARKLQEEDERRARRRGGAADQVRCADTDALLEHNAQSGTEGNSAVPKARRHTPVKTEEADIPVCISRPIKLRLTHYYQRLPDRDGLSPKYLIDALRSARLLSNDTAKEVASILEPLWVKVKNREEEKTVVEIFEAEPEESHK